MAAINGSNVLIVEDEYLLATDLERYFTSLGARVLGPVPSVEAAYGHVPYADAAVLDICLDGKPVFPLADDLAERRVPFVFYSGHGDIAIPERFRYVGYLSKPAECHAVFQALFAPQAPPHAPPVSAQQDVVNALPQLRLATRLHLGDARAADRLVELTLQKGLDDFRAKPRDLSVNTWLGRLMQDVYQRQGAKLLH